MEPKETDREHFERTGYHPSASPIVDVRWHIHLQRPINFVELLPDDDMYYGMEATEWGHGDLIAIARDSVCPKCQLNETHIHQYGDKILQIGEPPHK